VRTSNSFAQISKLVLASVRGGSRPRADHQFRTNSLESFEERITPTTIAYPGMIPYVPPGQNLPYTSVGGFTAPKFSLSVDTITPTVFNNTGTGQYVTFTLYTAPGGGEATTSHAYDNLISQKLVYSQTIFIPAGQTGTFDSIDVSTLHLTGQQKLQGDYFLADSLSGYAPDKLPSSVLDNHLIWGELFDYDLSNGKR